MVVMDVCELLWCEIEERKRDIEEPETQINDRVTEKRKREKKSNKDGAFHPTIHIAHPSWETYFTL
jgi:hypothetical protein